MILEINKNERLLLSTSVMAKYELIFALTEAALTQDQIGFILVSIERT